MRSGLAVIVFVLHSVPALAQDIAPRGGTDEWGLHLLLIGSRTYSFEGGASARNEGGGGAGISAWRNLNSHFAVGADLTFSQLNTRSTIVPGAGNAGARFESDGDVDTAALRVHATWYLLSGPVTPFVSAGIGATFVDPEFRSNPPADACWIYPWYGQACGARPPESSLTRLGYSAGAGVRFDLPRRQGFVRLMAGGEWIDFDEASSAIGYLQLRADFGIAF
jgi:opacity protein-like surface antigen